MGEARATRLAKFKPITMLYVVKFKITDLKLVNYLNDIHEIFLNEYEFIQKHQRHIQPSCFTKDELSHEFRGHFTSEAKISQIDQ